MVRFFLIKGLYNIQAGLSGQMKIYQGIAMYDGAFWYYTRGKMEIATAGIRSSETLTENSPLGGYLGFRMPLSKQIGLSLEGQYINNFSGGVYMNYKF
jgi:hypothetical protein